MMILKKKTFLFCTSMNSSEKSAGENIKHIQRTEAHSLKNQSGKTLVDGEPVQRGVL